MYINLGNIKLVVRDADLTAAEQIEYLKICVSDIRQKIRNLLTEKSNSSFNLLFGILDEIQQGFDGEDRFLRMKKYDMEPLENDTDIVHVLSDKENFEFDFDGGLFYIESAIDIGKSFLSAELSEQLQSAYIVLSEIYKRVFIENNVCGIGAGENSSNS